MKYILNYRIKSMNNNATLEKLKQLKEAAFLAQEEQARESMEQDEIIEELLEENKALRKLLAPIEPLIVKAEGLKDLETMIKEGVTAIRARKVENKVDQTYQQSEISYNQKSIQPKTAFLVSMPTSDNEESKQS